MKFSKVFVIFFSVSRHHDHKICWKNKVFLHFFENAAEGNSNWNSHLIASVARSYSNKSNSINFYCIHNCSATSINEYSNDCECYVSPRQVFLHCSMWRLYCAFWMLIKYEIKNVRKQQKSSTTGNYQKKGCKNKTENFIMCSVYE